MSITEKVIGAAIEVHRALSPGLLEATYEMCLEEEFKFRNIQYERQKSHPLVYRGIRLENGYRIDFLIENEVILEIKAVDELSNIHMAQLLTYLRLMNRRSGLLLNFNVALLKEGIRRVSLRN